MPQNDTYLINYLSISIYLYTLGSFFIFNMFTILGIYNLFKSSFIALELFILIEKNIKSLNKLYI